MPVLQNQSSSTTPTKGFTLVDFQAAYQSIMDPPATANTNTEQPQLLSRFDEVTPTPRTATPLALQLVPFQPPAEDKTVLVTDDLNTFNNTFVNSRLFHRMSGDQDKEARVTAYKELMNLMLSQTAEDKELIQLPPSRTN